MFLKYSSLLLFMLLLWYLQWFAHICGPISTLKNILWNKFKCVSQKKSQSLLPLMIPKPLIAYSKNLSSNLFPKILSKSPIKKPLTPSCFLKALLKSWSVSHFVAKTFLNDKLSQCLMKRLWKFHSGLGWGIS